MMTLRNFFVGRAVVFIILLIIGFAFFAYKKYSPTTTMPTETPTETSTENTGPVAFTWKYEEATSLNPDGNPNTNVFLEAKYSNGKTMSRLITVSPGSCNDLPDVPSDSVINSTAIQCYHAGLGYRFKITKSTTSYLIMRQVFEEGSPEYNPPVTNYEVDSQFPLTFSSDYKVITRATYSFQMPNDWILTEPRDFEGCIWDGIANNGGDGHRQNGEIGIYQKSCFDLTKSLGKKEIAEKDGFYIIAYYDKETGTTDEEITETKAVHQKVVSTFAKNQ